MKNFYREGRGLPSFKTFIQNKIKSKTKLTPSEHEESEVEELTYENTEGYSKYLASLIYEYQLGLKYDSTKYNFNNKYKHWTVRIKETYLKMPIIIYFYVIGYVSKRQNITVSIILLLLSNTLLTPVKGQDLDNINSSTQLNIGDVIPEEMMSMLFTSVTEGKTNVDSFSFTQAKNRPIILDFWSTWCGSCIDGLQKILSFTKGKHIHVFGVTNQNHDIIQNFFNTNNTFSNSNFTTIVSDTLLKTYFPHVGIPHLIWINSKGIIVGITGSKEVKLDDVLEFLETDQINLGLKSELVKNHRSTIWEIKSHENILENIGYTLITPFIKDLSPIEIVNNNNFKIVSYRNRPIIELYKNALSDKYSFSSNEIKWLVPNPDRYAFWLSDTKDYSKWLEENAICYEKKIEASKPLNMLLDLNSNLGLNVEVKDSILSCLIISEESIQKPKINWNTYKNGLSLKRLINEMTEILPDIHMVDETGRLFMFYKDINPKDLNSRQKLISYLQLNQLQIQEANRTIQFLIIK
jgi:thiol-disulfide isomerase/thioredoxin